MSDIRRTYFTMPGTFEPANPTKWAFVVTSIKVDLIETLTPLYYNDIDPDGSSAVDYARCLELPNGTPQCDSSTPINTYNPFLGIPLQWPLVNLHSRGKVIDTVGSVDYGPGIVEFGVPSVNAYYYDNYPLLTNIQQANGSFFIDIDYDKSYSFSIDVYEYQVFKFSYNARFNKDDATFSYSRLVNGSYVPMDKYGFLSGIQSNPYLTPPQPSADVCAYAIRTKGYAVPIILPMSEVGVGDNFRDQKMDLIQFPLGQVIHLATLQ